MRGADIYYDLIVKADRYKVDGLKHILCPGYGHGFQYGNIVFLLSEHARGKTFRIWIYEDFDIKNVIKQDHLEVYGVTSGQLGWTETYGWLEDGSWVGKIENIFTYLRDEIYKKEHKEEIQTMKHQEDAKKKHCEKVKRYDRIFANTKY